MIPSHQCFHKAGYLGNNDIKCSVWGKKHSPDPWGATEIVCDTLIIRTHTENKSEPLVMEGDVFILECKPWVRNIVKEIISVEGELITIKFLNHAYLRGSWYHHPYKLNDDDITTGVAIKFYPDHCISLAVPEDQIAAAKKKYIGF